MAYQWGMTVTVERPGGLDRFGDRLASTTHTVSGCAAWPSTTEETMTQRDTVIDEWMLFVPYGSDILSSDLVTLPLTPEPVRFEVDARPEPFQSFYTGWKPGTKIRLRAVKG